MESFILSCEPTVDLPFSYISSRNIPVLFYSYTVDGRICTDDMDRDPEALEQFYSFPVISGSAISVQSLPLIVAPVQWLSSSLETNALRSVNTL